MKVEDFREHMSVLGLWVSDEVTGFEGIATSVGFDLYGCVQVVVTPQGLISVTRAVFTHPGDARARLRRLAREAGGAGRKVDAVIRTDAVEFRNGRDRFRRRDRWRIPHAESAQRLVNPRCISSCV